MVKEDDFKNVLEALFSGISRENNKKAKEQLDSIDIKATFSDFGEIHTFNYDLQNVFEYLISNLYLEEYHSYVLLEITSSCVSDFFSKYITKHEGSPCSWDKTSHIMDMLLEHFKTGEVQNFDTSYSEEALKEYPDWVGKRPYWSPETLSNTQEAVDMFKRWYNQEE
jgi:hypothetical protein